ncbi:MAG TPA: hypothetical protein VHF45_04895 [Thermoleophilaceae bacterium]|nr:hypothetical protein [Thermoleophilaceae bacterium]
MTESITIRHTTEADREALRRLAELDGGHAPGGRVLIALADGEPIAAVGVDDGRAVADPFRYALDVVRTLSVRAEQERGDGFRRRLRWRPLGHRLGRDGWPA